MATNSRLNPSTKQDQGVDVGSMISAPLVAASAANTDMMRHQARFLMEFCFNKKEIKNDAGVVIDAQYEPRMIEMFMKKSVIKTDKDKSPKFEVEEFSFQVPILTLIPINSLAVDDVQVNFDMEIISQTTHTVESGDKKGTEERAKLRGKISYDSKESSNQQRRNSSKLSVSVHAGPLPLPVGVNAILEMYTKAILPIPKKK